MARTATLAARLGNCWAEIAAPVTAAALRTGLMARALAGETLLGRPLEAAAALAAAALTAVLARTIARSTLKPTAARALAAEARPVSVDRANEIVADNRRAVRIALCAGPVVLTEKELEQAHGYSSPNGLQRMIRIAERMPANTTKAITPPQKLCAAKPTMAATTRQAAPAPVLISCFRPIKTS